MKRIADKVGADDALGARRGRHETPDAVDRRGDGGNVGVGLEDSLYDGRALEIQRRPGAHPHDLYGLSLEVATPAEAREMLR